MTPDRFNDNQLSIWKEGNFTLAVFGLVGNQIIINRYQTFQELSYLQGSTDPSSMA